MSSTEVKSEVTTLPVADVNRAKAFYQGLGWRLDIDFKPDENAQETTQRLPGRVTSDVPGLAQLLHETAEPSRRIRDRRPETMDA